MPERSPSHLLPLESQWAVWRWFQLRSTGFAADGVLELASPDAAAAVDALLAFERRAPEAAGDGSRGLAEARALAEAAFGREAARVGEAARAVARDDRFREAIAWQNRPALRNMLDSLLSRPAGARDHETRRKELFVASYLQRYCMKNDTIGYFGPSVFGAFAPDGEAFSCRPGAALLRRRVVHLEYWAVDALASRLSKLPGVRPWLTPRRLPLCRLDGPRLVTPFGSEGLSAQERAVFERCDGERTARAIAAELAAQPALGFEGEGAVYAALDALEGRAAVSVALEIPPWLPPFDRTLRALLERVEAPDVRRAALEPLDRLEAAREALARAAGDAGAVSGAMDELGALFTELTGEAPTRGAGQLYAGRALAYEDCRRDVDVVFGPELRAELAPPLSLALASCRWLTHAISERYRQSLIAIYEELRGETGSDRVDFFLFWMRAGGLFKGETAADNAHARPAVAEFQARWARLLSPPDGARRVERTSKELAPAAAALFDAPCPGWPTARYHSPDVMIASSSPAAVRRGDYAFVLGEVHAGYNHLESSFAFGEHPEPDELLRAIDADLPGGRVSAVRPSGHGLRAALLSLSPNRRNVAWEFAAKRSALPRPQTIAVSDLVVTAEGGRPCVSTRDGGRRWDFAEWFDVAMGEKRLDFLPARPHSPRVTVDRLVLCREAWRFEAGDVPFARSKSSYARFVGARRWAREHGLPRFLFARASSEPKPVYVDLASPIYVDLLARQLRQSASVTLTELLPGPEQCWLADAEGRRYTSELRMVAVDPEAWRPAGR